MRLAVLLGFSTEDHRYLLADLYIYNFRGVLDPSNSELSPKDIVFFKLDTHSETARHIVSDSLQGKFPNIKIVVCCSYLEVMRVVRHL